MALEIENISNHILLAPTLKINYAIALKWRLDTGSKRKKSFFPFVEKYVFTHTYDNYGKVTLLSRRWFTIYRLHWVNCWLEQKCNNWRVFGPIFLERPTRRFLKRLINRWIILHQEPYKHNSLKSIALWTKWLKISFLCNT